MRLVWHGTASIEIVSEGGRLLFDPFVPLKGSPVPVKLADFDGFTDIFVTHGHLDHILSIPDVARRNPEARIFCTQTPYYTLLKKGVAAEALRIVRFGDVLKVGDFTIRALHGKHAVLPKATPSRSARILASPARGNLPRILLAHLTSPENDESVFYVVEAGGKTVCLMGSMNLRDDVTYPIQADLLVLPYNGWEDNLPPALSIIDRLQPQRILLDHYDDTFPPLTSPVDLSPIIEKTAGLAVPMQLRKVEHI